MTKHFTHFLVLMAVVATANAQSGKSFSDNFESYATNAWLAQTSSVWDTWSGTPSTSGDDVRVTNSDAYSGSKSIYFSAGPGPEDVVLPFGGLHEKGQFLYRHMMKIPNAKTAYFNFQGASSVGVTWAVEINFKSNGDLVFSNLSTGTMYQTTYPQGKWFEFKMYINLTRNEWHVYIDGAYIGYFANSVNKVAFLDLYPSDKDASFWVDDVSFIYAPPSRNNAGIELLTSPTGASCGKNDVKVRVVNNGLNIIDSVRVLWSVDGKMQPPVKVKTPIDTNFSKKGNRLTVTLDSTLNLSNGTHTIKAWTAYPNGVADTINFDDTLVASLKAEIRGVDIVYGSIFQGLMGAGTSAWPDTVCVGDTLTYELTPPSGYTSADLGTGWKINYIKMEGNSKAPVDTLTTKPSGASNYLLQYVADTSEENYVFKIQISVSVGTGGCDTVLAHHFFVHPRPHTAFTPTNACDGKLVVLTNKSKGGADNKYVWDFGDNTTSKLMNTYKLYKGPGTYTVTLQATSPFGCRASVSKSVVVYDIPEPKFGTLAGCDSSAVVFLDSSTIATGSIVGYLWEFGDGDTSGRQKATHLYKSPGTYTVFLTATSDQGCFKRIKGQTVVHPAPEAAISGMDACKMDLVSFGNATTYTGTDALTYLWDFGDGSTATDLKPTHRYAAPGLYKVKMKVISAQGCPDSAQVKVEVYDIPVAGFSATNVCQGNPTLFTNTTTIGTGSITAYAWTAGLKDLGADTDPSYTFNKPGLYAVQLIATGTGGCLDTAIHEVEVFPVPTALFAAASVCQGKEVSFDNQSTTTSDSLDYQWTLGDGNTSAAQHPKHIYSQHGTYIVGLLVTTEDGCTASTQDTVEIYPLPVATFSFDHNGAGLYHFAPDDSTLVSYLWDFGDGNTSANVAPAHTYTADGLYDVALTTTDINGCVSEETVQITVSTGIAENGNPPGPFQVFPNPFETETNIAYQLQKPGNVIIEVYSLDGKRIVGLVNQWQQAGGHLHKCTIPGPSGVYMVRMVIDQAVHHQRIVKGQ
ncbi:MAG: PKD domain-containing protein [Bacteroidetes bacterium]|nr:PKD domain-containing protein [Bacteroidota bacterium]